MPGTAGRTFVTREGAIAALGELTDLQLVDQRRLEAAESYEVHLKVSLDIEALPLPLQLGRPTCVRPGSLSRWTKWPLTP